MAFDQTHKKMAYDAANMNDHVHQRMGIVADKMVKNNKKMENNKEAAGQDVVAT